MHFNVLEHKSLMKLNLKLHLIEMLIGLPIYYQLKKKALIELIDEILNNNSASLATVDYILVI